MSTATQMMEPVTIAVLAPRCRYSLRLRPANAEAFGKAIGLSLPAAVGTVTRVGDTAMACIGPDEWLAVLPEAEAASFVAAAEGQRGRIPHALANISDREITLALEGPEVLALLATGIARDVAAIAPGQAIRTLFDTASVILWRDSESRFRMDVWRSFASHVRTYLDRAAKEIAIGL